MGWTSIVAIYALIWVMVAFGSLPFGVKTDEEVGNEKVPGQADSAPASFQPGRLLIRTTIIAAAVTALFVANFNYGWVSVDDFDLAPHPETGDN